MGIQIDSQQMRKKEGLDSQQIQIDSQQIQRVLKQQSLVEAQEGQRRRSMDLLNPPCLANASLPQQQGEDVRDKELKPTTALAVLPDYCDIFCKVISESSVIFI